MLRDLDPDVCSVPRCRKDPHISICIEGESAYLCVEHWLQHCEETKDLDMDKWKKQGPNGGIEKRIARRKS